MKRWWEAMTRATYESYISRLEKKGRRSPTSEASKIASEGLGVSGAQGREGELWSRF